MNEVDKVTLEVKAPESSLQECPFQPVKGFGKIDFEQESLLAPRLNVKRVDQFLSDDNIERDMPILNKSNLRVINKIRKMYLESIMVI